MTKNKLCDICNEKEATAKVTTVRGGKKEVLNLCREDYLKFRQKRGRRTPFESLLGSNLLDEFFGGLGDFGDLSSGIGYPIPRQNESVDIGRLFSEHTKELIQKAGERAIDFKRKEVDTEHLLYALTESDVVENIFKQLKVDPGEIREYIENNAPKGDMEVGEGEEIEIGISPRVKNVFELAFSAARSLGHGYIGPEHLLIGLVEEDEGFAGTLLRKHGVTPESAKQETLKTVGKGAKEGRIDRKSNTPTLDKYIRDLSNLAKEGKLDPVIGRFDEIETTIEILSRRTKNNPVLIGQPGVGKTAIVEGLAQRIESGDVPEVLADKRVVELNINSVVAGTRYRGDFEERIKKVVDEIVANKDKLIVFIDELHTIVGSGGAEGGLDVSNVIKPTLARGELNLIGATTLKEYQKHIEKDAALERRFQPVFIDEPTPEQTVEILRGLRDRYEAHHKIKISDEAITAAAELGDRYLTDRFLPDKAIDLIDQAAARVRIASTSRSESVKSLDDEIGEVEREKEYAESHKKEDEAEKLEKKLSRLRTKRDKELKEWREKRGVTSEEVQKRHVMEVVSKITGVPVADIDQTDKEKLLKLEQKLHERVIGQDEAVAAVSDAIRRSQAGLSEENKPISTFLFLGPTGVGKTELAKSLAWAVFGDEEAMVRIDMSEYMERHSVSRLVGSPPGYVGYEEGGQLTETIRRRPYSVVLLDEIEKAHPEVHNILLQIFDDGRLTDSKGRMVDFSNTIIIATSNIGSDIIQKQLTGKMEGFDEVKANIMERLNESFKPEFLNRIDEIIIFHALSKGQVVSIVGLQLERVKRTAKGQNIKVDFDKSVVNYLADIGYKPKFGARELKRAIRNKVENKLAKGLLDGSINEGDKVTVKYNRKQDEVVFGK